jgi:CubicO group peptidase (beta-lactamase class C family)
MQSGESTPAMDVVVHGHCAKGFEPVREAFSQNFSDGLELGAATSVVIEGETVVDLWAGYMDANRTRPWNRDTIVQVMSTTKGVTALVANRLVERGLLELDAPVAQYWPEFAQNGKATLPVRYLLTHQAGLPALDQWQPAGTLQNWAAMTALLAAQKPLWEPGSAFGYHALTFGFLIGEVIRRVTGKSVGQLIREEIAGPLGVDFELGFGEDVDSRVAELLNAARPAAGVKDLVHVITANPMALMGRAFLVAVPSEHTHHNARAVRAAENPSTNGHTNARALAKIYGGLAQGGEIDGVRLLSAPGVARASERQVGGIERVTLAEMSFGLGFTLRRPDSDLLGPASFGHPGFGGSVGLADPDRKLGFGYVMNQLGLASPDQFARATVAAAPEPDARATRILRALYAVL